MSEISVNLNSPAPTPAPGPKKKKPRPSAEEQARTNRRAVISSIIIGSIVVHGIALVLFGLWTVAQHFRRPEARFEVKKVVKIPPKTPEHKMNVAQHEAMAPKPVFNDKLISARPTEFALPDLPEVNMDQMLPLDPSELISDQVNGLVGSAALGSGLGDGFGGGGGTGSGMSFFGVKADGDRILLLFDVSLSVVNKANAAGIPLERIQEETQKLIKTLPITSQFSMIQFTGNYMPFTNELVAATPGNKKLAGIWMEKKWVTSGSMSAATSGVISNLTGVVGVLEKGITMRPDVIFLISDASFQWRPNGGSGFANIPYEEISKVVKKLQETATGKKVPIHFVAFQPKDKDVKEWKRIVRKSGGEFRILKEK